MYRRTLDGQTLTFGHEGLLYRNSFVMYDKATGSLWVHVTGECARGRYKGQKLEFVPSTVTTWGEWKKKHPKSLVVAGPPRGGMMGTFVGTDAAGRGQLGFHLRVGTRSKLYLFRDLEARAAINDTFQEIPLAILFDPAGSSASAWERTVDGRVLSFEPVRDKSEPVKIKDAESGSFWDPVTGRCLDGKLKDKALKPMIGTPIRLDRWRGFYPDGEVWRAP